MTTMTSTSQTNPAYDIPSFNTHDHLIALHQEITNFLHYQLHVWYTATASVPLHTTTANQRERETIIKFSRKSAPTSRHSNSSLRWLTTMPPSSTHSSRTHQSTTMSTGESSTGGQCHNGSNCRRKNDPPLATQSVSHSNCCTAYNPCADESDYNDNETPDITDLYGEEVYNNID